MIPTLANIFLTLFLFIHIYQDYKAKYTRVTKLKVKFHYENIKKNSILYLCHDNYLFHKI